MTLELFERVYFCTEKMKIKTTLKGHAAAGDTSPRIPNQNATRNMYS
jgi:hypothetical protein